MSHKTINPTSLGTPRGYSNGVITQGGRLLFIAGQIGWNDRQQLVGEDLAAQFDQALANVVAVVTEAGGEPQHIARMVIYVTDRDEYVSNTSAIGERYRNRMGNHYPAMALLVVNGLLEPRAKVEIEATAVLPA